MAISWGAWEGASPTRIRVGIEVNWEDVTHGEAAATATVTYHTDVEGNWSDTQTLTLSGSIDDTITFTNSQNNNSVQRASKSYTYTYSSSSYGSSPGDRTFTAALSGAFNGATPSKSVTSAIPKRPYGTPAAPTSVNVTRVSATSAKITWANKDTVGEPWDTVRIQYDGGANDVWNGDIGTTGGTGTSITDSGLTANSLYKWRVRAENSVGDSAYVETGVYYSDPNAPTSPSRVTGTGSQQNVSWVDGANSSMPYTTEVWVTRDGGVSWSLLTTVAKGTTSYIDVAASAAQKTAYRFRHKVTSGEQGTVYSAYSADTSMTVGLVSAPNPPTNLSPASLALISPTQPRTFTWQYNTTDTTAQTAYQIQYRVIGAGTWTTLAKTASAAASWTAAAGTFPDNTSFEWQVRTWGTATTGGSDGTGASAWSASATYKTVGDPNAARANKRVMRMDLETGEVETAPVMSLPPIGSILMFGGAAAPQGWLLCQGQSLLRTDYPDLFAVIGTAYGSVDSTHFNLPDVRDRAPVGASAAKALGTTGGSASASVTLTVGNLPPHTHTINHDHPSLNLPLEYLDTTTTGGTAKRVTDIANSTGGTGTNATAVINILSYSGTSGSGDGLSGSAFTVPTQTPYTAFNFIIKV